MPRPVCIPCARLMNCSGTGAHIEFTRRQGREQRDYQVYAADVYKCSGCGAEVAARFATHAEWEHYMERSKPSPILVSVKE